MGQSSGIPPINGKALRRARVARFMSQADVLRACAERGIIIDHGNLSKMENGLIRRPRPRIIPVLAEVVGLKPEDLFADEPDDDEADAALDASGPPLPRRSHKATQTPS
jgi:transcriptional regulator with XRE-family HTH domain